MLGEQAGFLGGQGGGADHRQIGMPKHQLDAAVRQRPHARAFPLLSQTGEAHLEVAQVPIDVQRTARLAVVEGVEMLVARERAGLVMEAAHQPVEELPHASRLALPGPRASAKSARSAMASTSKIRSRSSDASQP